MPNGPSAPARPLYVRFYVVLSAESSGWRSRCPGLAASASASSFLEALHATADAAAQELLAAARDGGALEPVDPGHEGLTEVAIMDGPERAVSRAVYAVSVYKAAPDLPGFSIAHEAAWVG